VCEPGSANSQLMQGDISTRSAGWLQLAARLLLRALVNPRLGIDLLRLAWAFRRRRWYVCFPFLPAPPREYMRWRMHTAYGNELAVPSVEEVVRFARWRREVMRL